MPNSNRIPNLYIHKQVPNFADTVFRLRSDENLMLRIAVSLLLWFFSFLKFLFNLAEAMSSATMSWAHLRPC